MKRTVEELQHQDTAASPAGLVLDEELMRLRQEHEEVSVFTVYHLLIAQMYA